MIAIKFLGLLALVAIASGSEARRVFGGVPARPSRFPYLVSVLKSVNHPPCGGALLNNRFVLTTAKCVVGLAPNSVNISVGATTRTDGTIYQVHHVILHPKYDHHTYKNDLAILHIAKPIALVPGRVQPISLPRQRTALPAKTWFVAFCRTQGIGSALQLKKLESLAPSRKVCLKRIDPNYLRFFHADNICSQVLDRRGLCDEGTAHPLLNAQNVLVGLNTWWSAYNGSGLINVSTLVYPNLAFIRKTIAKHH